MLMVDNLMDLTHLGYLHAKTIGGNPLQHFQADMKTVRTPTGVKFTRWMRNSPPPPSYVKAAGFQGRIDRLQVFEFIPPSTILQWTGATDAGSGIEPDDFAFQFRLYHGLTPETETTCFYFWSAANGYRQDDPATTEQLFGEIAFAFREDAAMVQAQQERLCEFGEDGLVDIASDATRMTMRRHIDRMLAAEQQQQAAE
jgi:vanillate O-demethylase monooxygenase subunit